MQRKTCWHCQNNGTNILAKDGCCKRCGTNLTKHKHKPHNPAFTSDDELAKEVLGYRKNCNLINDEEVNMTQCRSNKDKLFNTPVKEIREEALKKYGVSSSSASFKENILNKSTPKIKNNTDKKELYEGWNYHEHKEV